MFYSSNPVVCSAFPTAFPMSSCVIVSPFFVFSSFSSLIVAGYSL